VVISECIPCVGGGVRVIRVDCARVCQVLPGNCVHIGERVLTESPPETAPRRHLPTVSQHCASRSPLRSRAERAPWWSTDAAITPTNCPAVLGPVKPLRFAPSLTGCGLDRTCGPPDVWQLRDGRKWDRRRARLESKHQLRGRELRRYDSVSRETQSAISTWNATKRARQSSRRAAACAYSHSGSPSRT
jgi:hypothetical protein